MTSPAILIAFVALPILVVGGYVAWLAVAMRSRRADDGGFEYVYVDDDGAARELTDAEKQRLGAEFARATAGARTSSCATSRAMTWAGGGAS